MNNNGRNNIWTSNAERANWNLIDQEVHDEVNRLRVAAKVFPVRSDPNMQTVPAEVVDLQALTIEEGTIPFLEISRGFALTQSQVDNEAEQRTAAKLARLAAASVVLAEDSLIFQGQNAQIPQGVQVLRRVQARQGLLGAVANNPIRVPLPDANQPNIYGDATFRSVSSGIANLVAAGQPGPYALFLPAAIFADTHTPLNGDTPADRIRSLITGGFHGTGTLPVDTGLLVSLGGEPTNIALRGNTTTDFVHTNENGYYQFRVVEHVQFIVRDPRALVRLVFLQPPPQARAAQ